MSFAQFCPQIVRHSSAYDLSCEMKPNHFRSRHGYRPDIDGLRALAIGSVIAFHAFPDWIPGGYVGVDVFFVISGFLISHNVLTDLNQGRFSFAKFYARRIRRLFPALILVLAACFVAGWFLLLPHEYMNLNKQIVAATVFGSNLVMWKSAGYFDAAADLKPLLHLWSLGVEEQFYVVWPLLLFATWRVAARRRRPGLIALLLVIAAASFCASVGQIPGSAASRFYLPTSRLWELLMGSLLACMSLFRVEEVPSFAVCQALFAERGPVLCNIAACSGIVCLALPVFGLGHHDGYPGWWALVPTVGACLLILAGPQAWPNRNLLSHRALVFIGLISYPLYLWHWPILSFTHIVESGVPSVSLRVATVCASIVLAWLTHTFIEISISKCKSQRTRSLIPALLAVGLLTVGGISVSSMAGGLPGRLHAFKPISDAKGDWEFSPSDATSIPGQSPGMVLFFGDSYIQQYYPRMREISELLSGKHKTIRFYTRPGCAPVPLLSRVSDSGCLAFVRLGFVLAAEAEVETVIIGGSWVGFISRGDYYRAGDQSRDLLDVMSPANNWIYQNFQQEIRDVVLRGKRVFVVLNPPGGQQAIPDAFDFCRLCASIPRFPYRFISLSEHVRRTGPINAKIREAAQRAGAFVLDPADWMCDSTKCPTTTSTGVPLYIDATHLRASFVREQIHAFDPLVTLP
jgi:peptidoglycan/LPS O-acetylase OafA/YrhL